MAEVNYRGCAMAEYDDLLDSDEVAALLGLSSRKAIPVYRSKYVDFPVPVVRKGRCALWLRADVEAWKAAHSRSRRRS